MLFRYVLLLMIVFFFFWKISDEIIDISYIFPRESSGRSANNHVHTLQAERRGEFRVSINRAAYKSNRAR